MRRLLMLTALALAALLTTATTPTGGRARSPRQCPAVKVSCPDLVNPGESIDFNALLEPTPAGLKPAYSWQVSAGVITSGQGTASLKLDTTGVARGQVIDATVEVSGLPEGCERKASCTTDIPPEIIGCRLDVYGAIPFEDEKARLDNFAIELQDDPTAKGYMLCYGGRRGRAGEARRRCGRARGYLSEVRGIERERVVIVDGGYMEHFMVWLWVVPPGAKPPEPTPTVDPREVIALKNRGARKSRRR